MKYLWLIAKLNPGFRKINWNQYLTNYAVKTENQNLDYQVSPSFQGVNRLFVLFSENKASRKGHAQYYLSKVEI